jgi:hypothetical protein
MSIPNQACPGAGAVGIKATAHRRIEVPGFSGILTLPPSTATGYDEGYVFPDWTETKRVRVVIGMWFGWARVPPMTVGSFKRRMVGPQYPFAKLILHWRIGEGRIDGDDIQARELDDDDAAFLDEIGKGKDGAPLSPLPLGSVVWIAVRPGIFMTDLSGELQRAASTA